MGVGGWRRRSAAGGRALPPARTGRHAQAPLSPIGLHCTVTCHGDARRACVTMAGGFWPPLIPWKCARLRELVKTEELCSPVQGHEPSRSPSKDPLPWDIPARSPCVSFLVPGTDDRHLTASSTRDLLSLPDPSGAGLPPFPRLWGGAFRPVPAPWDACGPGPVPASFQRLLPRSCRHLTSETLGQVASSQLVASA